MILYLDTSALVKLYAEEAGSRAVRRAVADAEVLATSLITYVEMRSALARKARDGEIAPNLLHRCARDFEQDWLKLNRLPMDELLVRKSGDLAEEHRLRAFDALHLASAISLQGVLHAGVTFACFDVALNRVAQTCGLRSLPEPRA